MSNPSKPSESPAPAAQVERLEELRRMITARLFENKPPSELLTHRQWMAVRDVLASVLAAPAWWQPIETAKQENGNGPILVMARRVASDEPSRMWAYWNHREGWWYRFGASQPTRIYPTVWFDIDSIPQGPLK